MKKIKLSILTFLLLIIAYNCNNVKKLEIKSDSLCFTHDKYDTVVVYSSADNSPKCAISFQIWSAQGPNAHIINEHILKIGIFDHDELQRIEEKTVSKAIQIVANNHINGFKEKVKNAIEDGDNTEMLKDCYFNVISDYSYGRDSVICYSICYDSYLGGAHGSGNSFYLNFDRNTGKKITIKDVILSELEDKLAEHIALKIAKDFGYSDITSLSENEGIFSVFDPYVPENFVLEPDSITFVYQCEEIGPYAVGEISTKFAYSELKEFIK